MTTSVDVCNPKPTIGALAGSWDLPACFRILKPLTNPWSSRTFFLIIIIIIRIDVCRIQYGFQTEVQ